MDTRSMMISLLAARAGLPPELSAEELVPRLIQARPELAQLREFLQRPAERTSPGLDEESEEDYWNVTPRLTPRANPDDAPAPQPNDVAQALRTVVDTLARALGACAACWGTDSACIECGGRGRPGARSPDPMLFRELVLPAVRRWSVDAKTRERARSPANAPFSRGAQPPPRGNDHIRGTGDHPEERT